GVGWYRKQFMLPANYAQRRVFIDFDGIMANSDVWINGFHLGKRPYGYVSFRYELTGHLNFDEKENVLAVRADNSAQPASRWYSGAGIYRHVRLVSLSAVHFEQYLSVRTPRIANDAAMIEVRFSVINQSPASTTITLATTAAGPDG